MGLAYQGIFTPEAELSKKKRKRLEKMGGYEGVCAHWERKKKEYKERVKERKKVKKEEKEAEWQALTEAQREARKAGAAAVWAQRREEEEEKNKLIADAVANPLSRPQIVIDCDFENEMDDKCIKSMSQQVCLAHTSVRSSGLPCWLTLAGVKASGKLHHQLSIKQNFANWHLTFTHDSVDTLLTAHPEASFTYLTGDSPNTLESLDVGAFYLVGGIVDRNKHKGITLAKAEKMGIGHAKFPLDSFIERYPEHVHICKTLTTNHVVDILTHYSQNRNWDDAFISILPKRRKADNTPKRKHDQEGSDTGAPAQKKPKVEEVEETVGETAE